VTAVDTAVVPTLPLTTVFKPWLVTPAVPPNAPNSEAEPMAMADGTGGGATQLIAVKLQVALVAMVLAGTAKSLTPVAPLRMVAV